MSGGFEQWLKARGETLPPCSCSVPRLHDDAWRHESTCEYKIYREHFELMFQDRIGAQAEAAAPRRDDPLAPARGVINAVIFGALFWAIVAALAYGVSML